MATDHGVNLRGVVVEVVAGAGVRVRVDAVSPGSILGPYSTLVAPLAPGDPVILGRLGRSATDLVVLGKVQEV